VPIYSGSERVKFQHNCEKSPRFHHNREKSPSTATKHYYANGQRLATRADGVLYYVLGDPSGQSAAFVRGDTGQEAGHILSDPLGNVVTSTLPATLTERLVSSLDATGLQYQASRFYDPAVGSYVQPSPFGGAPTGLGWVGAPDPSCRSCGMPSASHMSAASLESDFAASLARFALNKTLITTGLEEPWPGGWARYELPRLARQVPDLRLAIGRQFIAEFQTEGLAEGISIEPQRITRTVRRLSIGVPASERLVEETAGGFRIVATNYYETVPLRRLLRSVPLEVPLFVLDAGFNAYFQYQDEADLPGDLRLERAVVGGTGNAAVSAGITFLGMTAMAGTCVAGTGPLCPLAIGALTLTADFTANLAFDARFKEPLLERIGLGRER
jgi:hypothetical protein